MQFPKKNSSSDKRNINSYQQFYDGTLRADDGSTFQINRVLLAQRSDYFRTLFTCEGNNTTNILVKGIESQTLRQILQYLYEGALHLNEKNVCDLMIASNHMVLVDLTEQCREFAIRNMTPNNCLSFLTIAARYKGLNIFRECSRYAKVHFEKIVKCFPEEIKDLPIEVLTQLLKDNDLNVTTEYTVRKAIDEWLKVDSVNRNRHISDLLSCIPSEERYGVKRKKKRKDPTLMPNPFRMEENSIQVTNPPNISEPLLLQRNLRRDTLSRLPKYLHVVISCRISGIYSGEISSSGQMHLSYDEELDFWRKIGDVSFFPDNIVPVGNYIYLFNTLENIVLRYDLLNDLLVPIRRVSGNRKFYCIAELNQKIYALGGFPENDEYTHTIECYSPDSDTWNPIGHSVTTKICAAVAIHRRIYALGIVKNNDERMMVTLVYDPNTDIWNTMAPPRILRFVFSAVVFENRLYLIGGVNHLKKRLKNVEEYDPVLDAWTSLPDLPFMYFFPKAVVVAGRIMVFENFPEDMRFFEVYPAVHWDGVTNTWQVTDRSFAFYGIERYRFGILDDPIVVRELTNRSRVSSVQWDRFIE